MKQTAKSEEKKVSNRIKERQRGKWELDVYREDEICILAGLGPGHSSFLINALVDQ